MNSNHSNIERLLHIITGQLCNHISDQMIRKGMLYNIFTLLSMSESGHKYLIRIGNGVVAALRQPCWVLALLLEAGQTMIVLTRHISHVQTDSRHRLNRKFDLIIHTFLPTGAPLPIHCMLHQQFSMLQLGCLIKQWNMAHCVVIADMVACMITPFTSNLI